MQIAIRVNGTEIGENEIAREVQYHQAPSLPEAQFLAARALIIKTVLVQEAVKLKLVQENELKQSEDSHEALLEKLIGQQLAPPKPDENSCRHYYQNNLQKFTTPPLLEASHILIAADPRDDQSRRQAKSQAQAIIDTLKATPKRFKQLVKEYSDCPSKEVGGSLGQITKGLTTPEFEQQIFSLNQGLAAYPIETRYGFHVVVVDRKIAGKQLEFDQVHEKIAEYLRHRVERKSISHYIHQLLSQADIEGIDLELGPSELLQ